MSGRSVYLMFANLGTASLVLFVLVMVVPFLPELLFGTVWTLVVGAAAVVILYLSWDAVKQGYSRFCEIITAEGKDEGTEQGD